MEDLPKNETIRLVTTIVGVANTPRIIEGKTSSTGKTISCPKSKGSDKNVRLKTEKVLSGQGEFRDCRSYELYSPEKLNNIRTHTTDVHSGRTHSELEENSLPEATHEVRK